MGSYRRKGGRRIEEPRTHGITSAMLTAHLTRGARGRGDDRVAVVAGEAGTLLVVADGAGGNGRGSPAADAVVAHASALAAELFSGAVSPAAALRVLDGRVATTGGQSTAVIVIVRADGIVGASVGDSGALRVDGNIVDDLTAQQARKPLLGSGAASPASFRRGPLRGTLLVATDGLLQYAATARIAAALETEDVAAIPEQLVALVRLRSGALPDDVGVVVCRNVPVDAGANRT